MAIKIITQIIFFSFLCLTALSSYADENCTSDGQKQSYIFSRDETITLLGWVPADINRCGGYYIEAPITYPKHLIKTGAIEITSDQFLFAQKGTSLGEGGVTITRLGQQIRANKALVYRDPETGKINSIELIENISLREPNSLIIAKRGKYFLDPKRESLHDILYRTTIYGKGQIKPRLLSYQKLQQIHKVYQLSAWGHASNFNQDEPKVYEFDDASYSTCPPTNTTWQVKAGHIELNKETGRGTATHARLLVKGFPIFYTPYLSFPIDSRRKTGFLWPTMGRSEKYGAYANFPFYWNLAPNYDTTITVGHLSQRGMRFSDLFRYLTPSTRGHFNIDFLPYDQAFQLFKQDMERDFGQSPDPIKQSELAQLESASNTRGAFNWENKTRFDEHWSTDLDFNYISDDYYLNDLSNNFNQVTQNQLLRQLELAYEGQHWNFLTRIQGYQTLHPIDQPVEFKNQYTRLPQLVLNGDYPDSLGGFDYFINNELTHFDITKNPGSDLELPIGNRYNIQPGISRTFSRTYLTVIPRLQFAMTRYELGHVKPDNPENPSRALPIFDINTNLYFDRETRWLCKAYRQTLEPQIYYTYIPYKNQNELPIFDTTLNTLTYDQLFMYNRFSGIDRINDANQVALGLTTRFIEQKTGIEKIKASLGQIVYFQNRRVTLCSTQNDPGCQHVDDPSVPPDDRRGLSPLAGLLNYTVDPNWSLNANTIWNPQTQKLDNQSFAIHYNPEKTQKIVNFGYNFVRKGDPLLGDDPDSSASNLSSTDFSFNWPMLRDWTAVGRWTQNWNHNHFQNLLYGLQYDSCCWAMRIITGRAFVGLNPNNTFQYNTQYFVQFALKGLGTVPVPGGDPSQLLNTNISGIQNNFGQDF